MTAAEWIAVQLATAPAIDEATARRVSDALFPARSSEAA